MSASAHEPVCTRKRHRRQKAPYAIVRTRFIGLSAIGEISLNYRLALSTIGTREDAEELARDLLNARLVACVNIIGPITSLYHWQGNIERDEEFILLMKTTERAEPALRARLQERHPYDTPEFIVLPIETGAPSYLSWISESIHQQEL